MKLDVKKGKLNGKLKEVVSDRKMVKNDPKKDGSDETSWRQVRRSASVKYPAEKMSR